LSNLFQLWRSPYPSLPRTPCLRLDTNAVHWIFKNKDHGKTSATASLGLIYLWDVEGGLAVIDKYMYSSDQAVVAGALLGIGVVNCGVQNENDPGELDAVGALPVPAAVTGCTQ
jgi:hypothetical protein